MQGKAMGGSGTLLIFRMAFFILMLGLSVQVAADPYKDAEAAYDRGDYGAALRLNKSLSDQGHADAQNNLGRSRLPSFFFRPDLAPIRTDSLPDRGISWMSVGHGHRIVGTA